MEMVSDQWAKLSETNLNATLRCAAVSTEAARRLCELQIQAIGKAWTEGAEAAVAFARDGDVFKALRIWPSLCDAGLHQMAQLPQMAIEMTAQAQAETLKAVNEDLALMARMMTENLKALTQPAAAEGASDGTPAVPARRKPAVQSSRHGRGKARARAALPGGFDGMASGGSKNGGAKWLNWKPPPG